MKVFTITETSLLTARLTKQDKKEWNGLVSMNQNCIDVDVDVLRGLEIFDRN